MPARQATADSATAADIIIDHQRAVTSHSHSARRSLIIILTLYKQAILFHCNLGSCNYSVTIGFPYFQIETIALYLNFQVVSHCPILLPGCWVSLFCAHVRS